MSEFETGDHSRTLEMAVTKITDERLVKIYVWQDTLPVAKHRNLLLELIHSYHYFCYADVQ